MKAKQYNSIVLTSTAEGDIYVGSELVKRMEKYKAPANLHLKKRRIGNVGLISEKESDKSLLGEIVSTAQWLIVVCSPDAKGSTFCNEILDEFLKLKGHDHVLAVLSKGVPDDSFLEKLLYREEETTLPSGEVEIVKKRVEPLAANFRGETKKEIKTNMNAEFLKMLAPIYGVNFDDLKQRHKEQKNKRIAFLFSLISIFFIAIGVVSIYSVIKQQRQEKKIKEQFEEVKNNQALSLAEDAQNALKNNDRNTAISDAYTALTEYNGIELNYTSEAHKALFDSVAPYSLDADFSDASFDIKVNGTVEEVWCNAASTHAVVYDSSNTLFVIDIFNGSVLNKISGISIDSHEDINGLLHFNGGMVRDNIFTCISDGAIVSVDCSVGEVISQTSLDGQMYGEDLILYTTDTNAYIRDERDTYLYNIDESCLEILQVPPFVETILDSRFAIVEELEAMIVPLNFEDYGNGSNSLYIFDLHEMGRQAELELPDVSVGNRISLNDVYADNDGLYVLLDYYVEYEDGYHYFVSSVLTKYNSKNMSLEWSKTIYEKGSYIAKSDIRDALLSINNNTINVISKDSGEIIESHDASGIILKNTVGSGSLYTSQGDRLIYHNAANSTSDSYYEKMSKYLRFNNMKIDVDKSYVGDKSALIVPDDDSRVILYTGHSYVDMQEVSGFAEQTASNTILTGSEAKDYATQYTLYKPYLIETIIFDEQNDYMIASYANGEARSYLADGTLQDFCELNDYYNYSENTSFYEENEKSHLSSISNFYGDDADGNHYYGSSDKKYGYVLNPEYKFIGEIKYMAGFDEDNNQVVFEQNSVMYAADVVNKEKLLQIAQTILEK